MGVKMGWIQIKMGHPLARNGAALAPFRANGAHPIVMFNDANGMACAYVRTSGGTSRMRTQM